MVAAHRNVYLSRDLTMPLFGVVCHTVTLSTKFEVSNSTHYKDIKGVQNVEIGVVWG